MKETLLRSASSSKALIALCTCFAAGLLVAGSAQAFTICGNGVCESGIPPESSVTCPADCPVVTDADGDGVYDDVDNCIFHANADQADCDNDGHGDICDGEDATWSATLTRNCYVDIDEYLFEVWTELYTETYFEDISSCGSAAKWVVDVQPADREKCNTGQTPEGCCTDLEGMLPGECNRGFMGGLVDNDTCHR